MHNCATAADLRTTNVFYTGQCGTVRVTKETRILFECCNLFAASPHDISSCMIVNFNDPQASSHWTDIVSSWMNSARIKHKCMRPHFDIIEGLFSHVVGNVIGWISSRRRPTNAWRHFNEMWFIDVFIQILKGSLSSFIEKSDSQISSVLFHGQKGNNKNFDEATERLSISRMEELKKPIALEWSAESESRSLTSGKLSLLSIYRDCRIPGSWSGCQRRVQRFHPGSHSRRAKQIFHESRS